MARFLFIGVSTARSSSMKLFPRWMEILGRPDVEIEGVDLPLDTPPVRYRALVAEMRRDPQVVGGLVTSHKLGLLNAGRDLFDELDDFARLCGEVSAIAVRNGRLLGYATDPTAGGESLRAILGPGYFATHREVLCLGAGGAGSALSLWLSTRPYRVDRPGRITAVDIDPQRLAHLRSILEKAASDVNCVTVCNQDPRHNDALMAALPRGSVVINATGLGKDRPGSPVTSAGLFPRDGLAWELNYRGERPFLHLARSQSAARNLVVEDGWDYFLRGWLDVIGRVLDVPMEGELYARCAAVAARATGSQ